MAARDGREREGGLARTPIGSGRSAQDTRARVHGRTGGPWRHAGGRQPPEDMLGPLEQAAGPSRRNEAAIVARPYGLPIDRGGCHRHFFVVDADQRTQLPPIWVERIAGAGSAHAFDVDRPRRGIASGQAESGLREKDGVAVELNDNGRPRSPFDMGGGMNAERGSIVGTAAVDLERQVFDIKSGERTDRRRRRPSRAARRDDGYR